MNIYEKLLAIQMEVKARKELKNEFGHFNYRSAEQIYEAVKPICKKHGAVLRVTDEVVMVGDKPYVKAIAELIDVEMQGETYAIGSVGWARIPDGKKGMDDSQVTGSACSYANKYCVSALFLLDNNKDPDSMDNSTDKEDAMQKNQARLDAEENWRIFAGENGDVVLVKAKTRAGTFEWKNIDDLTLKALEYLKTDARFEGIGRYVDERIAIIKGAK